MTYLEYKYAFEALQNEYAEHKKKLHRKYALANARFEVGDIVENPSVPLTLKIEKIRYSFNEMVEPTAWCVYYGTRLRKKDLLPYQSGEADCITERYAILVKKGNAK